MGYHKKGLKKTKNPLVMSGFRGASSPDASGEPETHGLIIFQILYL